MMNRARTWTVSLAHADNSLDVQEFMIFPLGFQRFSDALRCGCI